MISQIRVYANESMIQKNWFIAGSLNWLTEMNQTCLLLLSLGQHK